MKFAHLGDCHLGGWRQSELKALNFQSFQTAITTCINEKVDFILLSGDLFDMAYPSIDILKETFKEFRRLKENNIPIFLIAGSHDYSVAGKSFIDVLEKAGFCTNAAHYEEHGGKIMLHPTIYKNAAIYGYPGKKSGLEVEELENLKIQDAPGMFKILMLHTAIKDALGSLPVKSVNEANLPKMDYIALSHLHITYQKSNRTYSGPIFPNNITELEELKGGLFYIFEDGKIKRHHIKLKEIIILEQKITNALTATDMIIDKLKELILNDKIVILKILGVLEQGKISDIKFSEIDKIAKQQGAYTLLKSTSKLHVAEPEMEIDILDTQNLEEHIIQQFIEKNPSNFNNLIAPLLRALQTKKQDDEKTTIFQERLITEINKTIAK